MHGVDEATDTVLAQLVRAPRAEEPPEPRASKHAVKEVWGPELGKSFTAVSNYFLMNLHRLGPDLPNAKGLSPTEAMVVVQLFTFKWDAKAPRPALGTIAKRMGVSTRTVRDAVKRLEGLGLVRRELSQTGGCSRYHFEGLFKRLEALMQVDLDATDAAEDEAA